MHSLLPTKFSLFVDGHNFTIKPAYIWAKTGHSMSEHYYISWNILDTVLHGIHSCSVQSCNVHNAIIILTVGTSVQYWGQKDNGCQRERSCQTLYRQAGHKTTYCIAGVTCLIIFRWMSFICQILTKKKIFLLTQKLA